MTDDIRETVARYYDLQPFAADIPFYQARLPFPEARVLELGCGTGRVLIPLAQDCAFIHGIDSSKAMLSICREKASLTGLSSERIQITFGDITAFDLDERFDLIIAPFRVLQNLATDAEVQGLLQCIRRHLAPGGTVILNAFKPKLSAGETRRIWSDPTEHFDFETTLPDGRRFVRHDRRARFQADPLVLFPELIDRIYSASGELEAEAVLKIAMRCWYPDEFARLLTANSFRILAQWGGYGGEAWGEGPELVVQFAAAGGQALPLSG